MHLRVESQQRWQHRRDDTSCDTYTTDADIYERRRRRRYRGDRYIKHPQATQQYRSSAMLTTIRLSWKLKENPRKTTKQPNPKPTKEERAFDMERERETRKNNQKSK